LPYFCQLNQDWDCPSLAQREAISDIKWIILASHFNFKNQLKTITGKLIVEKADEIIDNLDTLTISTFEGDEEAEEQYDLIKKFLRIKGNRKPNIIIRRLGNMDLDRYKKLGCIIATRVLHSPMGSFKYKKNPTVPEIGICLDLLNHMDIKRDGRVSICVRLDPRGLGVIGDCTITPLVNIWNSPKRRKWLKYHIEGRRDKIPLCSYCEFWGVPTGYWLGFFNLDLLQI